MIQPMRRFVLVTIFTLGMKAHMEADGSKIRCTVAPVRTGEKATINCYFHNNIHESKIDYVVQHYDRNGTFKEILSCVWLTTESPSCSTDKDYVLEDQQVTHNLNLTMKMASKAKEGKYVCLVIPPNPNGTVPCDFALKKDDTTTMSSTRPSMNVTSPVVETKDDSDRLIVAILLPVFVILLLVVISLVIIFRCRDRLHEMCHKHRTKPTPDEGSMEADEEEEEEDDPFFTPEKETFEAIQIIDKNTAHYKDFGSQVSLDDPEKSHRNGTAEESGPEQTTGHEKLNAQTAHSQSAAKSLTDNNKESTKPARHGADFRLSPITQHSSQPVDTTLSPDSKPPKSQPENHPQTEPNSDQAVSGVSTKYNRDADDETPLVRRPQTEHGNLGKTVASRLSPKADQPDEDTPLMMHPETDIENDNHCHAKPNPEHPTHLTKEQEQLFLACQAGELTDVINLTKGNSGVGCKNKEGKTPVHVACEHGQVEIVEHLLSFGYGVNDKDVEGKTPLHSALSHSHTTTAPQNDQLEKLVKTLVDAKANPNDADNGGRTPLHLACQRGHLPSVGILLTAGADAKVKDKTECTPLHEASQCGNKAVLNIVCKHSDIEAIDQNKQTALHRACSSGNEVSVKTLLNAGADTNAKDQDDKTPLHLASQAGKADVIQLLLNAGAKTEAKNKAGLTPLHLACQNGNKAACSVLYTGTGLEARDNNGLTPLHIACENGHKEVVLFLVEQGADVEARTSTGSTPSRLARRNRHEDIYRLLQPRIKEIQEARNKANPRQ